MKKKDTIIVACLVNAALLSLLMLFAYEVPGADEMALPTPKPVATKELPLKEIVRAEPLAKAPATLDLGDIVLKSAESPQEAKPLVSEPLVVKEPVKAVKESSEEWYTIKKGDSPWKVANAHKISTEQILSLNHMSEEKARNLKPGDKIRIR